LVSPASTDLTISKSDDNLPNKVRYKDTLVANYQLDKDIKYKTAINYSGEQENLLLYSYSPKGDPKRNRPSIIWIHVTNDDINKFSDSQVLADQ
jgi:hypothetical protein